MTELTERLARLEMIRLVDEVISESDPDLRDSLMIQLGTSGLLAEHVEGQPKTMLVVDSPSSGQIEVKSWRRQAQMKFNPDLGPISGQTVEILDGPDGDGMFRVRLTATAWVSADDFRA